jgi:intracellular sulfur oxidation DsrE/DsrF family protein
MNTPSRRSFLSSVGVLAGASLIPEIAEAAQTPQGGWDLSFLDKLTGKHKQVFDVNDVGIGLVVVKNWLDAWESVYNLKSPDVNAIAGIAGKGFAINAGDALYAKYPIGEMWMVNDPATGKPATKSMHISAVKALQARGTTFWMCNNALNNVAGRLANATQKPQPEVLADLKAGLHPGVIIVPAHTMLVGIAQEKGFTYEAV